MFTFYAHTIIVSQYTALVKWEGSWYNEDNNAWRNNMPIATPNGGVIPTLVQLMNQGQHNQRLDTMRTGQTNLPIQPVGQLAQPPGVMGQRLTGEELSEQGMRLLRKILGV